MNNKNKPSKNSFTILLDDDILEKVKNIAEKEDISAELSIEKLIELGMYYYLLNNSSTKKGDKILSNLEDKVKKAIKNHDDTVSKLKDSSENLDQITNMERLIDNVEKKLFDDDEN